MRIDRDKGEGRQEEETGKHQTGVGFDGGLGGSPSLVRGVHCQGEGEKGGEGPGNLGRCLWDQDKGKE